MGFIFGQVLGCRELILSAGGRSGVPSANFGFLLALFRKTGVVIWREATFTLEAVHVVSAHADCARRAVCIRVLSVPERAAAAVHTVLHVARNVLLALTAKAEAAQLRGRWRERCQRALEVEEAAHR